MSIDAIGVLTDEGLCRLPDCTVDYLFGPLTPETLAMMRREARENGSVAWAASVLVLGEWMTAAALSRRTGLPSSVIGGRLLYAMRLGAPIESHHHLGYRLTGVCQP